MIYFELKQKDDILCTNLDKCQFNISELPLVEIGRSKKWEYNGLKYVIYVDEYEDIHSVIVIEGDKNLFKSLSLRQSLLPAMENILHHTAKFNVGRANDYAHSVNTLHGKMKQKIENYADPEEFYGETYLDVHEKIKLKVSSDPGHASDLILYLSKRITDIGAHLRGFEITEIQESLDPRDFVTTRLRSALLSSFSTIQDEMYDDMWVKLKIAIDPELRVRVDKELLNLVLYNIFDNTRKYILINSEIHANWDNDVNELVISMTSLAVNSNECDKIFCKNFRGEYAKEYVENGKGLGLFVVKRAMQLIGGDAYFDYRLDKEQKYEDRLYRENYFHLRFNTTS